jgi:hypothetical protein
MYIRSRWSRSLYLKTTGFDTFFFYILAFLPPILISEMMLLLSLVLAAQFFSFVSTSPLQVIPNRPDIATLSKKDVSSQWNAVDLNNEFKGIWWTEALSGGLDCTPEQIDKLVYATRAAMWMLQSPMEDPMSWFESIAFGRYFGRYSSWLNSGSEYLNASTAIFRGYKSGILPTFADYTVKITFNKLRSTR